MLSLADQANAFVEYQNYLVNGALDLFRKYGLPIEHTLGGASAVEGPAVMAVIGYAAPTVRGALLLLTSQEVVAALRPAASRKKPLTEQALRDTLGEFCNMLIGRVKNKMLARNVAPLLATPTSIFGDSLRLPVPMDGMSAWHKFKSPTGDIFVRLDATFAAEFEVDAPSQDEDIPTEGEFTLF